MAHPEESGRCSGVAGIFLEAASLGREEGSFRTVERLWAEGIVKLG